MKKWLIALVLCLLLVGTGTAVYAAQAGVQVTDENGQQVLNEDMINTIVLNGEKKDLGNAPGILIDGKVMLPRDSAFRKIMGMKMSHTSSTVTLRTKEHTAKFTVNSKVAVVDGQEVELTTAPLKAIFISPAAQTTMISAEDVAKIFEYDYAYDAATKSVSFSREGGIELSYGGVSYYYKDEPITMKVNGEEMSTTLSGFYIDDTDFVPAWSIAKGLGIKYSKSGSKITMTKGDHKVVFTVYKNTVTINGETTTLSVAPTYILNKDTNKGGYMVPAEVVAEALGFRYEWDESTNTINFVTESEYQIQIPLPEDAQDGNYEVNDNYFNYKYEIIVDGQYTNFYKENPINNDYLAVDDIQVTYSGNQTKIILQANEIKGYRLKEENGILYVKVGTPKEMYDKIIVLDAGHGGTDPGAAGNGLYEKNCTLNIVNAAKSYFDADGSVKVYYTRTTNTQANITSGSNGLSTSTSLRARTDLTNTVDADLFISVHINSATNTSARGTEVYYTSSNNKKNEGGLTASKLAQMAYDNMVKAVGSTKRGVKSANFYVTRYTNMPSILIETAFISNKQDAAILKSDKKIDQMGKAVYDTVISAFQQYPTGR